MKIIISLTIAVLAISTCQGLDELGRQRGQAYNALFGSTVCSDAREATAMYKQELRRIHDNKEEFCEHVEGRDECSVGDDIRELHNDFKELLGKIKALLELNNLGFKIMSLVALYLGKCRYTLMSWVGTNNLILPVSLEESLGQKQRHCYNQRKHTTVLKMKIIISLTIAVLLISTCQGNDEGERFRGQRLDQLGPKASQCSEAKKQAEVYHEQLQAIYRNKAGFCRDVRGRRYYGYYGAYIYRGMRPEPFEGGECSVVQKLRDLHHEYKELLYNVQKLLKKFNLKKPLPLLRRLQRKGELSAK
ncbi:unnamed protein product [Owenia fusiformis]|uniref:Uncharacterized protein n=1 Tax=Owenia fusiformis TaxID=6347 RepID=A0A8J1TFK3_OWEFU|nr:unnamed protein product [Owenia fusiformis]